MSLSLTVRIIREYAHENYFVVSYANGERPTSTLVEDEHCVIVVPTKAWSLFILIYATIQVDDGAVCTFIGHSTFTGKVSDSRPILDIQGNDQGSIVIVNRTSFELSNRPYISTSLSQSMEVKDISVYADPRKFDQLRQVFYEVETVHGRFPLIGLPLQSTMVTVTKSAIIWLEECFTTALCLHGVDPKQYTLAESPLDIAGTAMTLLLNVLKYENDYTRGERGKIDVDQWLNILLSPDLPHTGYDCEDGTLFVISMFHAITTCMAPKDSLVEYFAKLLRPYTIGAALCEINSGGQYIGHSVPIAIETAQLKNRINLNKSVNKPKNLPPLLFETTSWQDSVWTSKPKKSMYSEVINRLDRSAKVLTPVSVVMNDGTYRKICKAQFPNLEDTALSITVFDDSDSMNVLLADFLRGTGRIHINSHLNITETAQLKQEMCEFPKFRLPEPAVKYTRPAIIKGIPVLFRDDDKRKFILWESDQQQIAEGCTLNYFDIT